MYEDHSIGVVVPAYNETGYVGPTIETMPAYVDRVYVIDDASTDETWSEITEHAEAENGSISPEAPGFDERVVPIRHEENRGVGGAIKTGYLRAREDGVDVTAVMGGDNQMNPAELHRYLDPIVAGEADYTKGSRFLRRDDWADMPRFRLVGNVLLSYLTKVASGYWQTMDPQNGYTAISRSALERVPIEDMYEYYGYCNDLLVKLNVENCRVADVPRSSTFAYEDGWKSHIDYAEYVPRVSGMLLRNFVGRIHRKYLFRNFHPLGLLYFVGVAVAGAGLARAARSLLRRRDDDAEPAEDGRGRGGPTTALLGVVLLVQAAVLDAEDNRELEFQVRAETKRSGAGVEATDEHAGGASAERLAEGEPAIDGSIAANGGFEP